MRLTFRNIFFHGAVIFRGPLPKQDAQLENTCFKRATQNPPRTDNARQVIKPNESCIIWGSATEPQIINFHFKSRVCARFHSVPSIFFAADATHPTHQLDHLVWRVTETECEQHFFVKASSFPYFFPGLISPWINSWKHAHIIHFPTFLQSPYSPRTLPVTVPVGIYHSPRGFPYRRGGQG